jgi:lysine 2,3-aminomutase
MLHFNHPDEFLIKDDDGEYIETTTGILQWVPATKAPCDGVSRAAGCTSRTRPRSSRASTTTRRPAHHAARAQARRRREPLLLLRSRHRRLPRLQRPDREAWQILNESQKGLSGVENARPPLDHALQGQDRGRAVTNEPIPGSPGHRERRRDLQAPAQRADAPDRGKVCIVGRNPDAIWFDDYEDRVLFDEAGLFDYARVVETFTANGRCQATEAR